MRNKLKILATTIFFVPILLCIPIVLIILGVLLFMPLVLLILEINNNILIIIPFGITILIMIVITYYVLDITS